MQTTISDLPMDEQLTSLIALQIDGYGMSQTCNALKHIPDAHIFSRACSVMLSLEVSKWIHSMKPYGDPPDSTTLNFKMRNGIEICIERYAMDGGDGGLRSIKSIIQREVLEKVRMLCELGRLGKLFIVEPEGTQSTLTP